MDTKKLIGTAAEWANLLQRVNAMENRIAELEAELELKSSKPCPDCGFPLFPVVETKDGGVFDDLGAKTYIRRCPRCSATRETMET